MRGCSRRMARAKSKPLSSGRPEIAQHDVGTVCAHAGECAHAVVRDVHLVTGEPQEAGEIFGGILVVIDY